MRPACRMLASLVILQLTPVVSGMRTSQLLLLDTNVSKVAHASRVAQKKRKIFGKKYQEMDTSEATSMLKEKGLQFIKKERVGLAYNKGKDIIAFTNKRFIHVDSPNGAMKLFSSRIIFKSIAWSSVVAWSVQSAGTLELIRADTELRLWTDMPEKPYIEKEFWDKKADIYKMKKYITDRVLGGRSSSLMEVMANKSTASFRALPQWLTDDGVELDAKQVDKSLRRGGAFADILQDDEIVEMAFRAWRDMMVMTSKRIIDIDIKGVGGAIEYKSVPYRNVRAFSIETAGGSFGILGDKDVEMELWTNAAGYNLHKYKKEFNKKKADIYGVGAILASHIFNVPYTYKKPRSLLQVSEELNETWLGGAIAWLGNDASEVNPRDMERNLRKDTRILLDGESVDQAYKVGRDSTVMTNYRILFIDVKGLKGKKIEFVSLPYTSIRAFAVESAGTFDFDAELNLWTDIHYDPPPCSHCSDDCSDCSPRPGMSFRSQDFRKGKADIFAVSKLLSSKVVGCGQKTLNRASRSKGREDRSKRRDSRGKQRSKGSHNKQRSRGRHSRSLIQEGDQMSSNTSDNGQVDPLDVLHWLGGDASEVDPRLVQQKFSDRNTPILLPCERVEMAFKVGRDFTVLTTKRILLVDKQGLTGKKIEYLSIPYSSVTGFSVESAGTFDLDAEMKFSTSMWWEKSVISQDLRRGRTDIQRVSSTISKQILGDDYGSKSLLEQSSRSPVGDLFAWLGNDASEIDPKEAERRLRESSRVLLDGEHVVMAYKVGRDSTLLTTKRLLKVDVKDFGKKIEWRSLPWRSVKSYRLVTANKILDNDAEFEVLTNSVGYKHFSQDLRKGKTNIHALENVLADYMF